MKPFIAVDHTHPDHHKHMEFDTLEEAQAHVKDNLPDGIAVATPAGGSSYWVVDHVAGTVTSDTAQEAADILSNSWASIRSERNALITATDWRVLPDQPVSQPWMDYRQALRDVTNVETPDLVVWPTEPGV